MKRIIQNAIAIGAVFTSVYGGSTKAQNTFPDVKYWVGSGQDSAVLIVDFHDQTWDTCYTWGYLFNGTTTGETMLNAIASADTNFSINVTSGFLNDVIYHRHSGIGGSPDWWSTWSGTDSASLSSNGGIATTVNPGDWFACSYTDFAPAIPPGSSIPAFDSAAFSHEDPTFWVGSGSDTSILVVDFLDGLEMACFAWGYLHDGTKTGEDMLIDIAAADPNLTVNLSGGFLLDIVYDSYSGMSGSPNFWGTWSATNLGNWDSNGGPAATNLSNGDFFGCSYTDFSPALRPGYPQPAMIDLGIAAVNDFPLRAYPNPVKDILFINGVTPGTEFSIFSVDGRFVSKHKAHEPTRRINLESLRPGTYLIRCRHSTTRFIKE